MSDYYLIPISDFVGYLKGKSALMIFDKHPELGSKWDRSFWVRGYYVATVGNVNEETVKEYIRRQTEESMNEEKKETKFRQRFENKRPGEMECTISPGLAFLYESVQILKRKLVMSPSCMT